MVLGWKLSSFLDSTSQVFLTWLTNKLSTGVLDRNKTSQTYCKTSNGEPFPDDDNKGKICLLRLTWKVIFLLLYLLILPSGKPVDIGLEAIKHGWKEYMQQPVLPASLAYVLLYFNVVLTPGSLMTAFLTQHGTFQTF